MKNVLYPGSFNPFTIGHADIVKRALKIFDHIYIAISINPNKYIDDEELQKRFNNIKEIYKNDSRVTVIVNKDLVETCAKIYQCSAIVKGVRNSEDLTDELIQCEINRYIGDIETILIPTQAKYAHVSSTLVRTLMKTGLDYSEFIP